jgi:hypothetical protein
MKQELAKIEAFIEARDIKKAEAAIAKLLRSNPSTEIQAELCSTAPACASWPRVWKKPLVIWRNYGS